MSSFENAKAWFAMQNPNISSEIVEYGENKISFLFGWDSVIGGQIDIFNKKNFNSENDFIELTIFNNESDEIILNKIQDFNINVLDEFLLEIIKSNTQFP